MKYISRCCNKIVDLIEQQSGDKENFEEIAILCTFPIKWEKVEDKQYIPKVDEDRIIYINHKIDFNVGEEFNTLYIPPINGNYYIDEIDDIYWYDINKNETYKIYLQSNEGIAVEEICKNKPNMGITQDFFENIALVSCKFNKIVEENKGEYGQTIQKVEVKISKVVPVKDFLNEYQIKYIDEVRKSPRDEKCIQKEKWKLYCLDEQGDILLWELTYTDNNNIEHCLIKGQAIMDDEDIAYCGNIIYKK